MTPVISLNRHLQLLWKEKAVFAMELHSPLPSTPLNGVSPRGKWSFAPEFEVEGEPELEVRKKLVYLDESPESDSPDEKQWNSTSGYFSQSAIDSSGFSIDHESPTNLFDENSPPLKTEVLPINIARS